MSWQSCRFRRLWLVLSLVVVACSFPSICLATNANANSSNNNNSSNSNNTTNTNSNNATNSNNQQNFNGAFAGIDIDTDGILRVRQVDSRLSDVQRAATLKSRKNAASPSSAMRKVSINRLEKALANSLKGNAKPSLEMASLAGLVRIEYVFFLPGSNDIVLAGPAEETAYDNAGRPVGLVSGRPTVRLDDLIVALRAYGPDAKRIGYVGCSIDPTQEGLARLQAFYKQIGPTLNGISERELAIGMKNSLGFQNVTISGIPATTHFAQTLVEADYRMKLIGIGLENPGLPLTSWVARANPYSDSSDMQRWFFVANYDQVKVAPNQQVLKLEGQGVMLVGEEERVMSDGNRQAKAGKKNKASAGFTKDFTQRFDKIADRIPVYHEMRNLFDTSVAAAFIQNGDFYSQTSWDLGVFADEKKLPVENIRAAKQVEAAINTLWKDGRLMAPIGGGVEIKPRDVLSKEKVVEDQKLNATQNAAAPADLAEGQWWWD